MAQKNDLLLRTARGEHVDRPPVWLMRQAGRILPEYRAIRNRLSGFKELVSTPELAAEVTIQPVDALGVDAAIIFSDILVIPECMGLDYDMVEKRGPVFPKTIQSKRDVDRLRSGDEAAEHLEYVYEALRLVSNQLQDRVPTIGFAGSPWTLLAYMVEGSGSKTFSKAKKLLYADPATAEFLLERITETTISYLRQKIAAGAELIQIFDSWAGILSPGQYKQFSLPYIRQICEAIDDVPVTVFAKGAWFALEELHQLPCEVLGIDWNTSAAYARSITGDNRVLQGNMDPCQLYGSPEDIETAAQRMVSQFGRNHIANLGHGVYPDTPVEHVRHFVQSIQSIQYPTK